MYDVVSNSIMAINTISLPKSEPDLLETTAHLNRIGNEAFQLQEEDGWFQGIEELSMVMIMIIALSMVMIMILTIYNIYFNDFKDLKLTRLNSKEE